MASERNFKYSSVLLIDDNSIDNFISENLIQKIQFSEKVYIHSNADNALKFLNELLVSNAPLLDYIFLDIYMPIIDGWEFLEECEKLALPENCKIILLTVSRNHEDEEKSNTFKNVVGFISKPLTLEKLKTL